MIDGNFNIVAAWYNGHVESFACLLRNIKLYDDAINEAGKKNMATASTQTARKLAATASTQATETLDKDCSDEAATGENNFKSNQTQHKLEVPG